MEWKYLESDPFKARQILAAHHLKDCKNILEVGGYKTPITQFLQGYHESVTVVDPLAKPYSCDTLNGKHCEVRHLPIKIEEHKPKGNEDGFLFLGMEEISQDASARIIDIMKKCKVNILEFAPSWFPAAKEFNKILETGFFHVDKRIILDLSGNNFGDLTDSYAPHPIRHMYLLVPKEQHKTSDLGAFIKWLSISRGYLASNRTIKTAYAKTSTSYAKLFLKEYIPTVYKILKIVKKKLSA